MFDVLDEDGAYEKLLGNEYFHSFMEHLVNNKKYHKLLTKLSETGQHAYAKKLAMYVCRVHSLECSSGEELSTALNNFL